MAHEYDYLIIGAGMAGSAAAIALRKADPKGSLALLGAENHPPYERPPLSKGLWGEMGEDEIWTLDENEEGMSLQLGRRAVKIDRQAHTVTDDAGETWTYKKLLLATGGTPRTLPFGKDTIYFRTYDDYKALRAKAKKDARVTVIGGGFIGSEIAASLASNGCKVTMVFPEDGICARAYPKGLSDFVTQYYRDRGVDVRAGIKIEGASEDGSLQLSDGSTLNADVVVAGLGIIPNIQLAQDAGLEIDQGGIVVNQNMQSSDPDIYAAGDVAVFPAAALGKSIRVEHEDAALSTGEHAGRCMAGEDAPYEQLPFFYSDLFDLGYEAVGTLNAQFETVEQWAKPHEEGVVYYLDDGRVRGVLLWNTWDQIDAARQLIAQPGPFDAQNVKDKLPQS